ncbi:hypothetical protein [Massilia brevitalea]|uniref:hypothetical protein n=1 Tax=Massilia brevitalea TaxID=442526 RepID=UPI002738A109|nr:hypothetical protein [Massilia brevitalea]
MMASNNDTDRGNMGRQDEQNAGGNDSSMSSRADTLAAPVSPNEANNQQQGAGSARQGGFPSASPESNVNPAGAPQSSHGSASGPIPGGTVGASRGDDNRQSVMGAAAAGGNPGTSMGNPDGAGQQSRITGVSEGDEVEKLAQKDEGGAGGADSR